MSYSRTGATLYGQTALSPGGVVREPWEEVKARRMAKEAEFSDKIQMLTSLLENRIKEVGSSSQLGRKYAGLLADLSDPKKRRSVMREYNMGRIPGIESGVEMDRNNTRPALMPSSGRPALMPPAWS
jgi:hypothetical protein